MTLRVPWNSTLFGAFFVAGAIFSGIAILILVMAVLRRAYGLGRYVTDTHFVYLGYLMAAFAAIMLYANISELMTHGYKMEEGVEFHFRQLFLTEFGPYYWFYLLGGLIAPIITMLLPWTRNARGAVVAAVLVTVAMWIERYVIVVSGLRVPLMPYEPAAYAPTWVEWSMLAAGLALFALLITIFTKLFPILAVWEIAEDLEVTEPPAGTVPAPSPAEG
jgi:molybdopterin-containing oxidoreductase family membrane subunit